MKVNVRRVSAGELAFDTAFTLRDTPAPVGEAGDPLAVPGSGDLELQFASFSPVGALDVRITNSTTDEFVRAGESLRGALAGSVLWETLHPNTAVPDDARVSRLSATLTVECLDRSKPVSAEKLAASKWVSTLHGLYAYTPRFTVPPPTDTLRLSLTITDALDPQALAALASDRICPVPVFGGDLPAKTLLFDQNRGAHRDRIIEGDDLVAGSTVTIGYTDWRADQLVDRSNLNTQIGTATAFGRFGQFEAPIHGRLVHEVTYGIFFNDAIGWRPEAPLAPNTTSRMLGPGRTSYETPQPIPAGVDQMMMYAHVKAHLVADYTPYGNVTQKWYSDNQQILLADEFDNPSGPFTNYVFHLQ